MLEQSRNSKKTETPKRNPITIAVTSGKGGVGKSSLSVNLALIYQNSGRKTLVFDADINLGNVDVMMGVTPAYTLYDAINNDRSLSDIVVPTPYGVDILAGTSGVPEMIDSEDKVMERLQEDFSKMQSNYDTVILDTGAGVAKTTMAFVLGADVVVVLVTPDPASISDAYAMIKLIKQQNPNMPILLVANRVASEEAGNVLYKKMSLIVRKFLHSNIFFGASIMENPQIQQCVRQQKPVLAVYPRSRASYSFHMLQRRLTGLSINKTSKEPNLFENLATQRVNLAD